jgi:hypothetical protein
VNNFCELKLNFAKYAFEFTGENAEAEMKLITFTQHQSLKEVASEI